MKGQQQVNKAIDSISEKTEKSNEEYQKMAGKILKQGSYPKDALGLSDGMVEGIYGQAYRLYNTGKYEDAAQLFKLLILIDSTESKYSMGLAACFHMNKDYSSAIEVYALCGVIDSGSPLPHYHSADCYIQMKDKVSAVIALEMAIKRAVGKPEYKTLEDRAKMMVERLKKELFETKS
jgi:type III secretion system low calcium response chaperone LcrH/SycD